MKWMDLFVRQGENRRDTWRYREDFLRSMADKDAISCQCFGETKY